VQTGVGATGKFWAHEHWGEGVQPDMVTFSKKFQAAGFYYRSELKPDQPYRIYNTWMGDPARAYLASAIIREIRDQNLLSLVETSGKSLQDGLSRVSDKYPNIVSNVRGQGTFCAFDCTTPQRRDELIQYMRGEGIVIGGCGERTVRLRPMLVLGQQEVGVLVNALERIVQKMAIV